jgi:hypothetical protein
MHRPHRHLDGERDQEGEEEPGLCGQTERQLVPVENRETATRLDEQIDQRNQEQQRPHEGKQEELERRIDPVGTAPDANDQVQGNQRSFEEDVEQHAIQRRKNTVQQAGHDQEAGVVLRDLAIDDLPAGENHGHRDEAVEEHEEHRDAIDAEMVVDVESRNPADAVRRTASLACSGQSPYTAE